MYKAIIFDVDGTIIDTEKVILRALKRTLENELGKTYKEEELRFVLGIPGEEALKKLKVPRIKEIHRKWTEAVAEGGGDISLFAGIEEVIQHLANGNVRLGVVTSKLREELRSEFTPFGLDGHFETMICADDTCRRKPDPDPLVACMEALNVKVGETIYIGDSSYDNQSAHAANVDFGLAYWGAKTTEGYQAEYIFKKPSDVLCLL
ncbi:HAD family hydrolase [Salsuginibacillus kocurii]|uniref:HAD family hydrolase n=1 Tax=Salsuginibacillus kocurii TaxID=427078 RepID=UPI000379A019|nr:HAD family hydrolase [Salsuginibacillus kocurii]